jgi:hypothetical protein
MSAETRVTIAPTVRHAIRISSVTAVFEHVTASHATWSSYARVWPASCRAHGTPRDRDPVLGTRHARSVGFQHGADHAEVQGPPPLLTLPLVIAAAATTTATTPGTSRPRRADVSDQQALVLVELDPVQDCALDPEQPGP